MTIAVYSSADLVSWRKEGLNILPIMQDYATPYNAANNGYMETCGVFSRKTGFWNLWFLNAAKPYYIATAVSRSVGGPYEIVNFTTGISGTANLYLYFNVSANTLLLQYNGGADVYVCTVQDDFLTVETCEVGSQNNTFGYIEGGGVFQHGGATFVMAGHGCCFCTLGSNGYVWRSDSEGPLGSYTYIGDIIPVAPNGTSVTHAQQFGITPIYTTQGAVPLYIGIRFGQAPDGVKDHDPQYWYPLQVGDRRELCRPTSHCFLRPCSLTNRTALKPLNGWTALHWTSAPLLPPRLFLRPLRRGSSAASRRASSALRCRRALRGPLRRRKTARPPAPRPSARWVALGLATPTRRGHR